MNSRVFSVLIFCLSVAAFYLFSAFRVQAATCSITTDTVIDQAGVDAGLGLGGGACTNIEINGNVSTTWIGTVDLNGGGTGTVTVKSTYTMTMGSSSNMILGSTDDFVVETNATATHAASDPNGLKISARNVTVSGALSAFAKGCPRSGPSGDDGFGVNVATGLCAYQTGGYGRGGGGGGAGGGGGSHAAVGGGGGSSAAGGSTIYGNSLYPNTLGSGGGTGYYGTAFGGAGGGIVHVTSTGTLTITGRIEADGQIGNPTDFAYNGGGGGAGGSVLIHAGVLAGSGIISANGGAGREGGGGGGAGRVSVRYDSLSSFSLSNISATKGSGGAGGGGGTGADGGAGTTFVLNRTADDGAGTFTVTSGFDFPSGGDYARDTINITSGAALRCSTVDSVDLSSVNWLVLSGVTWSCANAVNSVSITSSAGISTTSTTLTFSAATSVTITAPVWTNVTTTINVTQHGASSTWDIASGLILRDFTYNGATAGDISANGGVLSIKNAIGLTMVSSTMYSSVSSTSLTALSIDANSSINATGKGCPGIAPNGDHGYGPNTTTGVCGKSVSGYGTGGGGGGSGGGGGAHAGTGGNAAGGAAGGSVTFGSNTDPTFFGSSGGTGYYGTAFGGSGGGVIRLVVSGALTLHGSLKADGAAGRPTDTFHGGAGGGAGGSIYISVGSLTGAGSITANGGIGGAGGTGGGGGGGGGRVAMILSANTFSGTSSTTEGAGGDPGGAAGTSGSIYTLLLNQSPDVPVSLGQTALVNGSTTGTNNPVFTFTLSDPDVDTVQYRIQIDDSSSFASPVVDYTSALAAEGTRSFQVGQAAGSGAYTVGSVSQTLSNGSYYWRVKTIDAAAAESSYTTANSGAVAFIVDATPRYLRFADSQAYALESITATSIRILLNASHFETVSVNYAVTENTATGSGTDFTLSSGTVTIPSGNTTGTISLSITDDSSSESEEYLVITLSSPQYATIGSNTSTSYIIIDNDQGGSGSGGSTTGGGGASAGSGSSVATPAIFSFTPSSPAPQTTQPSSSGDSQPPNSPDPAFQEPAAPYPSLTLQAFREVGTTPESTRLGSGERLAILADLRETLGEDRLTLEAAEAISQGRIPRTRNLSRERAQLPRVQATFRTIYGHNPDFRNPEENLAWNTLMYRIRFDRDLALEREGITEFRRLFGRAPQDPFQWSVVRVLGYVDR